MMLGTASCPLYAAEGDWEVATETDSDDDTDYFGQAYDEALKAEMRDADVLHPINGPPTTANGNAMP